MKQPPFSVMCIKSFTVKTEAFKNIPEPKVLDEDTVTGIHESDGLMLYTLERFGRGYGYAAECFATLPDPSEEVAIDAENEALIYQK